MIYSCSLFLLTYFLCINAKDSIELFITNVSVPRANVPWYITFFFLLSPRRCNYNVEKIYSNFFFYVFKTFYDVWNDMTYFICY